MRTLYSVILNVFGGIVWRHVFSVYTLLTYIFGFQFLKNIGASDSCTHSVNNDVFCALPKEWIVNNDFVYLSSGSTFHVFGPEHIQHNFGEHGTCFIRYRGISRA